MRAQWRCLNGKQKARNLKQSDDEGKRGLSKEKITLINLISLREVQIFRGAGRAGNSAVGFLGEDELKILC